MQQSVAEFNFSGINFSGKVGATPQRQWWGRGRDDQRRGHNDDDDDDKRDDKIGGGPHGG